MATFKCVLCGGEEAFSLRLRIGAVCNNGYVSSPEFYRERHYHTGPRTWTAVNDYVRRVLKERQVAKELAALPVRPVAA